MASRFWIHGRSNMNRIKDIRDKLTSFINGDKDWRTVSISFGKIQDEIATLAKEDIAQYIAEKENIAEEKARQQLEFFTVDPNTYLENLKEYTLEISKFIDEYITELEEKESELSQGLIEDLNSSLLQVELVESLDQEVEDSRTFLAEYEEEKSAEEED